MISTATAIFALCPTAKFSMNADDYNQMQWHSDDITKPTLSEVNAKISELEIAEPMRCLLYTSPSPRDATLSRMPSSA